MAMTRPAKGALAFLFMAAGIGALWLTIRQEMANREAQRRHLETTRQLMWEARRLQAERAAQLREWERERLREGGR